MEASTGAVLTHPLVKQLLSFGALEAWTLLLKQWRLFIALLHMCVGKNIRQPCSPCSSAAVLTASRAHLAGYEEALGSKAAVVSTFRQFLNQQGRSLDQQGSVESDVNDALEFFMGNSGNGCARQDKGDRLEILLCSQDSPDSKTDELPS